MGNITYKSVLQHMGLVRRDGFSFLDLNLVLSPCDLFKTLSKAPCLARLTGPRRCAAHTRQTQRKNLLGKQPV